MTAITDTVLVTDRVVELVLSEAQPTVVVDFPTATVVENTVNGTVTSEVVEISVVTIGEQGPPGATRTEDEMAYSKRIDFVTDSLFYRGEAAPGAATGAQIWRISQITVSPDGDVYQLWAGGTAEFDKAWDDRLTLSYS